MSNCACLAATCKLEKNNMVISQAIPNQESKQFVSRFQVVSRWSALSWLGTVSTVKANWKHVGWSVTLPQPASLPWFSTIVSFNMHSEVPSGWYLVKYLIMWSATVLHPGHCLCHRSTNLVKLWYHMISNISTSLESCFIQGAQHPSILKPTSMQNMTCPIRRAQVNANLSTDLRPFRGGEIGLAWIWLGHSVDGRNPATPPGMYKTSRK